MSTLTYFCKHTYIPVYIIKCEIGPLKELWKPNKSYENQYGENMHGSILSFKLCRWNTIPRNFIRALPPKIMIHENFGAFWQELQEFIFPFLFAQSRHSNVCECPRWAWEVAKDFRLISFSTVMDMYVKRNFFSSRSVQFNLNKKIDIAEHLRCCYTEKFLVKQALQNEALAHKIPPPAKFNLRWFLL